MVAGPLRSRILLNPVMKSMVTAQLRNMTVRLTVKLLVRKQALFRKKHTDHHQAMEAGFLIAAP